MARARRHYIPGHIWHLTHRCHKKEFLLKFAKDRHCWLRWLFEAKKRYGLLILNYMVTSNHIHLLVKDDADGDVIPRSLQLVAGRTGQEYNDRKKRKGAFWQDRYHATAVESGEHLMRCIVYIDLNMVRAGAVTDPSQWPWSGYNEILNPRRKCILIDYEILRTSAGFDTFDNFRSAHGKWIGQALKTCKSVRESQWTQSIAVGSEQFAAKTGAELGFRAKGRKIIRTGQVYQLRDKMTPYEALSDAEKSVIAAENSYYWSLNDDISDD